MVELFLDGGPFMYPILLLLLRRFRLRSVERFRSLSQSQADSDGFMEELIKGSKSWWIKKSGMVTFVLGHDGPVSNICKAGLDKSWQRKLIE